MRVLAGTTLIAVAVSFGAGQATVQNGAVRNRVDCESLAGLAVPAAAIGLPTSGPRWPRQLIARRSRHYRRDRAGDTGILPVTDDAPSDGSARSTFT